MNSFKRGQWVKFTGDHPGAHTAKDGKVVGIYAPAYTDATGEPVSAHVAVVQTNGQNLVELADGEARNVRVDPADLKDLEPAKVPDDCPPRRVTHLVPVPAKAG